MKILVIKNGKCITPFQIIKDSLVAVEGGKIIYAGRESGFKIPSNARVINAEGKYISPGFIDIQINGGNGSDTLDGTTDAFRNIINFHSKFGVTTINLTLVSTEINKSVEVLKSIRDFKRNDELGDFLLGAHLEGPYISPSQSGAHDPKFVRKPHLDEYKKYYNFFDIIKLVTQAPEVPGVLDFCSEFIKNNITASIGHSNATFEETEKAVRAGFSMVTHIYSVMSTVKRIGLEKIPGVIEAALLMDELWVEVIGDGRHVPEPLFKLVLKNKGVGKIILSSDAIRAAGMRDGKFILGDFDNNNQCMVENGVAMSIDKKLYAGSTITMDKCVKNAIRIGGVKIEDAVAMATINPARLLKIDNELGSISKGKRANIIIFDDEINVSHVIQNGKIFSQFKELSFN